MSVRYNHISILIVLLLIIAGGCTSSTKPNTPYSGSYPTTFNNLTKHNPLFAQEFGKIPEIQDGISEKDALALKRICVFYDQNIKDFDSALILLTTASPLLAGAK